MPEKNIPQINQDFDVKLLLHVLTKNLVWIVFLFVLGITSAFLLIRYTKPVYRAQTVIQFTSNENDNMNVLDEKLNPYDNTSTAKDVELIRSPVFLQRVVNRLPVDINYYSKGAILNFETYKSNPFWVVYDTVAQKTYGQKFSVKILDKQSFEITSQDLQLKNKQVNFGDEITVGSTKFRLYLKPNVTVNDKESYFFIFNNPQHFVNELANTLEVKVLSEAAKTVEVSYTGYNPVKVADVVNAIAKEFEYFNVEKKQESANRILGYIDRTLGIVSTSLSENEKDLNEFLPGDLIDPYVLQLQQSKSLDKLTALDDKELATIADQAILEKVKKMSINGRNDVSNVFAIIAGSGLQLPLAPSLDRFNVLFSTYEDLSYSSPESSPTMSKIKYQLEQQRKAYEAALQSLESVLKEKLVAIRLNKRDINVPSKIGLDTNNLSASMLKRTRDVNEKFFNQLIEKKAEYAIAKEGFTPEYQILDFASVPEKPIAPNKQTIILTAIGSWFLLSLLLVGVRYLLNDEILLLNDISKFTDAPILGMIHKYKEDIPVSQLVVDRKPKGLIAEAFRTARTNLQFIYNEPGPKVIALTSTISGEGKTFVSINLAGILAFSGNRVIIIDCDMRKPKIHVGFEVDNEFGMSTILIGKSTVSECIRKSQMENLDFITAGPIPPNPAELLLTAKMDQTIAELKEKYDFIVIDNPPSGLVSDAIVNLQRADYPIYVFRSDYSRKFFINNLIRLKEENKISRISCILNSVDLQKNKSYGYGYGYGSYNYGYGYGYGFGYYEEETGTQTNNRTSTRVYNIIRGKKNPNHDQ